VPGLKDNVPAASKKIILGLCPSCHDRLRNGSCSGGDTLGLTILRLKDTDRSQSIGEHVCSFCVDVRGETLMDVARDPRN